MSVNIAGESNVTFVLTYEEVLQRKLGKYEILTRVKPKQPVHEFQVNPCSCLDNDSDILNELSLQMISVSVSVCVCVCLCGDRL